MSQTRDQQRFTISEVAAVWHEPMGPQRIMWPSTRPLHRGKISRTQRSKVPLTSTMPRFCGPLCIHRAACTDLTSRYEYTQHFLRFTQCINYSNQLRLYMKTVLQSFIHCLLSLVAAGQYNTQICHTVSRLFFYRATRMHSADYAVARCLSVWLSVCLSVRPSVRQTPVLCANGYTYPQSFLTIGYIAPPF